MTFREQVLQIIKKHEKEYNPVDDYVTTDELGWLYEEIRLLNDNPWHTGTPTEEGDYLLILKAPKGKPHYFTNTIKKDGRWRYVFRGEVIAYQKIEPYKEKEDGHTD